METNGFGFARHTVYVRRGYGIKQGVAYTYKQLIQQAPFRLLSQAPTHYTIIRYCRLNPQSYKRNRSQEKCCYVLYK